MNFTPFSETELHRAKNREAAKLAVESVIPEKQKEFILCIDEGWSTALHTAAGNSRTDVVEYLSQLCQDRDELILKQDCYGKTALHHAETRDVAEVLVSSVTSERQREFILSCDKNGRTTLHAAASDGRTDVVEYLCRLHPSDDELVLKKDRYYSGTALHYAANKDIAKLLVSSVTPKRQREFILSYDTKQRTALHAAASEGRTDVVEYLTRLYPSDDELILRSSCYGWTALHYAKNRKIAELLLESVSPDVKRELVFCVDEDECTALHAAATSGRTDVVAYLCGLYPNNDELVLKKDSYFGRTALHFAENGETAKVLVEAVTPEKQKDFIFSPDKELCTALHVAAAYDRPEVVEYLCRLPPCISADLLLAQDAGSHTPLHNASSEAVAQKLLFFLELSAISKVLVTEDDRGNTCMLWLCQQGQHGALSELLQFVGESYDSQIVMTHIRKRNKLGQNILHLAALSASLDELFDVLQDYLHLMDVKDMMHPDIYGNTPIHYVAAKYNMDIFTNLILHLPMSIRQGVLGLPNIQMTDCTKIIKTKSFHKSFYFNKILCNRDAPNMFETLKVLKAGLFSTDTDYRDSVYKFTENILKVLKYCLNEYSLLDSAYTMSHTLFSSAVGAQYALVSTTQRSQMQAEEVSI